MLALYRQKDGVEKRFTVSKSDLKVSPIYLHKDQRIEAMLLINMLALLVYSLLERQVRQGGLPMTTRRIIQKLENLDVIACLGRTGQGNPVLGWKSSAPACPCRRRTGRPFGGFGSPFDRASSPPLATPCASAP
jgi:hypothetical protein